MFFITFRYVVFNTTCLMHIQDTWQMYLSSAALRTCANTKINIGNPEMDIGCPEIAIVSPEMEVVCPEMDIASPEMEIGSPEMDIGCPEMAIISPEMEIACPDMAIGSPEMETRCSGFTPQAMPNDAMTRLCEQLVTTHRSHYQCYA